MSVDGSESKKSLCEDFTRKKIQPDLKTADFRMEFGLPV